MLSLSNKKTYKTLLYAILFIGVFLRVVLLDRFPAGLNCDEVAASYNAFSILNTLADKNGMFLPAYFLNVSGGQSALFIYLSVPFVKIFGLNPFGTRLPMAVISSISLFVFYRIMSFALDEENESDRFKIIFSVLFFTLNPWHIMKSRWGLDCNLFPEFVLFGIYFLIKYLYSVRNDKSSDIKYYIFAFIFLSLSAYTYATSYLALSTFVILFYIYGLKNKYISIKQVFLSVLIVLIITWPLILFIIINFFKLDNINLIFMTIPRLMTNRMAKEASFSFSNIISTIKLLIFQNDGIYWNVIPGIGMAYIYAFPFFLLGVLNCCYNKTNKSNAKKLSIVDDIFLLWLISGFILCLSLKDINVNRANYIIIPFIYFITKGFLFLCSHKVLKIISVISLIVSFVVFSYIYIGVNLAKEKNIMIDGFNVKKDDTFSAGLEPVIKYVDKLDAKDIYLLGTARLADNYVLYYLKMPPSEYKNVVYFPKSYDVHSFGKWHFEKPVEMKDFSGKSYINMANVEGIVYVLPDRYEPLIDKNVYTITKISHYIVCEYRT